MTESASDAATKSHTSWGMDAKALSKWTTVAQQGGIGSCVAIEDFMATSSSDLMFLEGDEITVLEKLEDGNAYLGYCEGVVGRFYPSHVRILSNAPMTSDTAKTLAAPAPADGSDSIPLTPTSLTFTAASPTSMHSELVSEDSPEDKTSEIMSTMTPLSNTTSLEAPLRDGKRVSGPFELDYGSEGTPSPGLDRQDGFFAEQQSAASAGVAELEQTSEARNSTGSADWGGIGWMTGADNGDTSQGTALASSPVSSSHDERVSGDLDRTPVLPAPATMAEHAPMRASQSPTPGPSVSPTPPLSRDHSLSQSSDCHTPPILNADTTHVDVEGDEDLDEDLDDDWDIYGDYARQSMYFAPGSPLAALAGADGKRRSVAQRRASRQAKVASRHMVGGVPPSPKADVPQSRSPQSSGMQTLSALLNAQPRTPEMGSSETPLLPKTPVLPSPSTTSGLESGDTPGRSLASELRMRIQQEKAQSPDAERQEDTLSRSPLPNTERHRSPKTLAAATLPQQTPKGQEGPGGADATAQEPLMPHQQTIQPPVLAIDTRLHAELHAESAKDAQAVDRLQVIAASPTSTSTDTLLVTPSASTSGQLTALGSPIPLSVPFEKQHHPPPPGRHLSPALPSPSPASSPLTGRATASPHSPAWRDQPPSVNTTPVSRPPLRSAQSSHASPHSVDATQAAVSAAQPKPDGERIKGLTLVGRMETDLTAASGPMPISFLVDRPAMGEPTVNMPTLPPVPAVRPNLEGLGLGLPDSPGWGQDGPMPTSPRTPFEFPDGSGSPLLGGPRRPSRNLTMPTPTSPANHNSSLASPGLSSGIPGRPPPRPRPRSRSFSSNSVQSAAKAHEAPRRVAPPAMPSAGGQAMARSASATERSAAAPRDLSFTSKQGDRKASPVPLRIETRPPLGSGQEIPESATLPASQTVSQSPISSTGATGTSAPQDSKKGFWSSLGRREPQPPAPRGPATADISPLDPAIPLPSTGARSSSSSSLLSKVTTTISSTPDMPPASRSTSFSIAKPSLLLRKTKSQHFKEKAHLSNLPSPVSHKDYEEETVKQDGMEFELMKPLARKASTKDGRPSIDSPSSPSESPVSPLDRRPSLVRRLTTNSDLSKLSQTHALPETDEWGFLRETSPVPELLQRRSSAAGDHRAAEAKWLALISVPLPSGAAPPKKVRKMVLESGVPSSLRGRVWGWFMSASLSARVPGLYAQLLAHDKGQATPQIDADVASCYKDHSVFAEEGGAGQQDLRAMLRAYANFSPSGYRSEMALIGGGLLMHVPAEEAFWLLSGLIGRVKDYYTSDARGLRLDTQVFTSILMGSDVKLAKFILRDCGVKPIEFLRPWLLSLFARTLPWPTMLRIWDAVVCEGPRFLLQTSLAILTLSRGRLLALPATSDAVLGYLLHLPQDALLSPENVMKASEAVKLRDEDLAKLRLGAEKVLRE